MHFQMAGVYVYFTLLKQQIYILILYYILALYINPSAIKILVIVERIAFIEL